ncbi:hypothetical protein ACOBQX_22810 [Actinokineospora sp. G85]|uniref:hypothetical protein n=1 Tax=Actinokineospora sp. G85 TaxID=3406626 RepID=UPI003C708C8C
MSVDDPRAALRAAMAAGPTADDAVAALAVLRQAVTWAAAAMTARPDGGIELVMALDDALEPVPDLARGAAGVVAAGVAGTAVTEHLRQRLAALADTSALVASASGAEPAAPRWPEEDQATETVVIARELVERVDPRATQEQEARP